MKYILFLTSIMGLAHAAGGISGGGGNVINPIPPKEYQDPREIRHIIKGSKELLRHFVDAKYVLYRTGSMDYEEARLYSVLFADDENNLHEIMKDIKLDIKLDRPCYDQAGKIFDGSTFNQDHHSICLSAYNIAKKVDREEVPVQSTALILHEYSEVVGLSDEDAIELQTRVLKELKEW